MKPTTAPAPSVTGRPLVPLWAKIARASPTVPSSGTFAQARSMTSETTHSSAGLERRSATGASSEKAAEGASPFASFTRSRMMRKTATMSADTPMNAMRSPANVCMAASDADMTVAPKAVKLTMNAVPNEMPT